MYTADLCQRTASALRSLYGRYGYRPYKMSKFEEYDLYARNKDFLISDSVITFTDTNGKLMALKPDVTLSMVKNSKDTLSVQKLYYQENVYRVSKDSHGFREIMQMGLECLGRIDGYTISEVLLLAAKSLALIAPDAVLDISHLGLLSELMDSVGLPKEKQPQTVRLISQKNPHELTALCRECGIPDRDTAILCALLSISGSPSEVLPKLEDLLQSRVSAQTLSRFRDAVLSLSGSEVESLLRIDFSVVDDIRYYDGFVFKGFIKGIPGSVLTGGQYDKLMRKMDRSDRAIGFALYMDMLERLERPADDHDVDVVLLYDDSVSLSQLRRRVAQLTADGTRVSVQRTVPEDIRYQKIMRIADEEVQTLGNA